MSDGMRRELVYLSSYATNRYFIPNCGYNFKILSCKEYRGFEFLGISSRGDTIREHLSPFWDLYQKYSVGDKIVKLKGTKEILLIKQNDTLRVRLYYKREEL